MPLYKMYGMCILKNTQGKKIGKWQVNYNNNSIKFMIDNKCKINAQMLKMTKAKSDPIALLFLILWKTEKPDFFKQEGVRDYSPR